MSQPLITIITPTWDRAAYLARVWEALVAQTCQDFEWIVCDDGSEDDTERVVRGLAARSKFPVLFLKAGVRVGKARMDNEAIAAANGELILWNDSDDYLLPNAIGHIIETWRSIPASDRLAFIGVTALCQHNTGGLVSAPLARSGEFDMNWNELQRVVRGDTVLAVHAGKLKTIRFPEVDFVVSESAVWSALGHLQTRVLSVPLKIVEYGAPHAISFSGKMEYCRGRAYALAITTYNLRRRPGEVRWRFWRAVNFVRYSIHGEIGPLRRVALWQQAKGSLPPMLIGWPLARILAWRDQWRGNVVKTHRGFEKNKNASITAEWLN